MDANSSSTVVYPFLLHLLQWRETHLASTRDQGLQLDIHAATAVLLCLVAASLSSAGGIGGGALFLPILNLVAGVELKTATAFSAFMVTGGSVSNVLYNMFFKDEKHIDFDIALLSEPCMLLGVSLGVICNVVFPEWLVTLLFVMLLAFSTLKTCRTGLRCWKAESDALKRDSSHGGLREERISIDEGEKGTGLEEPLLEAGGKGSPGIPWKKVLILLFIWLCFYAVQSFRGGKNTKSIVGIEKCSVGYWLVSSSQIPLALMFTVYVVVCSKKRVGHGILSQYDDSSEVKDLPYDQYGSQWTLARKAFRNSDKEMDSCVEQKDEVEGGSPVPMLSNLLFPVAAFLAGVLGGLFGIGGGLLMNPVLLHVGVKPQVAAATSSFMVLFSSSMSAVQYLMIGMKHGDQAAVLSMGCFVASVVGVIIVQRAVKKYGRASLIIFIVSTIMALSTVSMTCFGALDVYKDHINGYYMGFKPPC